MRRFGVQWSRRGGRAMRTATANDSATVVGVPPLTTTAAVVDVCLKDAWALLQRCRTGEPGTECIPFFVDAQARVQTKFAVCDVGTWLGKCSVADRCRFLAISGYFGVCDGHVDQTIEQLCRDLGRPDAVTSTAMWHHHDRPLGEVVLNLLLGVNAWALSQTGDNRLVSRALELSRCIDATRGIDDLLRIMEAVAVCYATPSDDNTPLQPLEVDTQLSSLLRQIDAAWQADGSASVDLVVAPRVWSVAVALGLSGDDTLTPLDDAPLSTVARRWPASGAAFSRLAITLMWRAVDTMGVQRPTKALDVDSSADALRPAIHVAQWALALPTAPSETQIRAATTLWLVASIMELHEAVQSAEIAVKQLEARFPARMQRSAGDDAVAAGVVGRLAQTCLLRAGDIICRHASRPKQTLDVVRFAKRWVLAVVRFCIVRDSPDELKGPLRRGTGRALQVVRTRDNFAAPLTKELKELAISHPEGTLAATDYCLKLLSEAPPGKL